MISVLKERGYRDGLVAKDKESGFWVLDASCTVLESLS